MPAGYDEQLPLFSYWRKQSLVITLNLALLLKSKYKTMLLPGVFVWTAFPFMCVFVCLIK